MRINNNFNVLPFYDSLQKQNSKKWYSFGQHYPLICPNNAILPFQFITDSEVTVSSNIEAVNVHSGKVTNLGVKPSVSKGTQADATYYIVKMVETTISAMPEGLHYLRINTNKGYLYSEEFTYNVNHEECIKIEYWNENTLNFNSGEINFDDDFRFILYIPSTIGKPEYEFEEELTKRLGYKFIESQTSNKIYKFNFLAPEYICDAMRLIRLCDYIKLTTKFDTFNALSFAYEPKWQDNGDLAAVDVEFDTDCIIQKLESFNRRLKESFYNALLADIDEPVLFSNDIVAQYYTEFTTTSYINGKLIRQLEAINEAELGSLENLVLPIDNQSDTEQKAKKITLASLKNVLIKLADYVTLSSAQNINGEKNFIGGLKVNGSPIVYDAAKGYWKLQGNLVLTGGITMYADDGSVELPSLYDGLPIDGTTIYWETDEAGNRVLKAVGGGGTAESVAWSNITGKPSWIGSSKPTYTYTEIQNTPDLSLYAKKTDIPSLSGYATESWVKQQNYATKSTTLSGYGITDAYTKTNVDDLLKSYVTIGGTQTITGEKNFTGGLKVNGSPIYYDTEKKYWKLEGDLLVTGGVTMYGNEGTYTPSTIMDAISVDGTTISKEGGILKVIGGTGGGVAGSVAWANITGKPTFATVATSGKYSDLSGTPSSLPASDVYSWAKAATKPTYTWSEITSKPTWIGSRKPSYSYSEITGAISTTELQNYLTQNSYLNVTSGDNRYLKLSGGTLTDGLTISAGNLIVSGSDTVTNSLYPTKDKQYTLGNSSRYWSDIYTKLINGGTPWTSVNDGSGSGLDADLLDGYHAMDFTKTINRSVDDFLNFTNKARFQAAYLSGQGDFCSLVIPIWTGNREDNWYLSEFRFANGVNPKFRMSHNGSVTSDWREFAFTDSNVASATKLQTARTIWGQSFDGSSNVDGDFTQTKGGSYGGPYGGQNFYIYNKVTSDVPERYGVLRWAFDDYAAFRRLDIISKDFEVTNTIISFLHNGNVGIGTTNPSQKLHIVGNIWTSADIGAGAKIHAFGNLIANGMAGIGIENPTTKLHVLESSTHNAAKFETYAAQSVLTITKRDGISWALGVGIKDNGDSFGWWTTTGQRCAASIDVSGNFWVNGGITMYSDQRKKTILNHVELSLKQIAEAPLIEHYYNSDDKKTTHVGSIAQYWASMNDWFCKLDSEGFYTMEIQNAALASAISIARELDRYETKTDKSIKKLKKRISELEDEVERLKCA